MQLWAYFKQTDEIIHLRALHNTRRKLSRTHLICISFLHLRLFLIFVHTHIRFSMPTFLWSLVRFSSQKLLTTVMTLSIPWIIYNEQR